MAISLNSRVDFNTKANLLMGGFGAKHGDILIGNQALEFYNSRNPEDFLQIPWQEIHLVRAQILFGNRYIRGFYLDTKANGTFNFVVKDAGKCLKQMQSYLKPDQLVRAKTRFFK
ncbi:DUF956 family protein [Vaginisenegalia massiliensis]|uniref:DUF956 family protein n=1 Tax=Vaginisenegalia massiliensis TaxID=2058294 RepID=UPI000F53F27A|nr:DUF956 family protein [Vaginisenegalia massiliensis]